MAAYFSCEESFRMGYLRLWKEKTGLKEHQYVYSEHERVMALQQVANRERKCRLSAEGVQEISYLQSESGSGSLLAIKYRNTEQSLSFLLLRVDDPRIMPSIYITLHHIQQKMCLYS